MTPLLDDRIEDWLARLDAELAQDDPALRRDALSDARDHFTQACEAHDADDGGAVDRLLEEYGEPRDVADQYRAADRFAVGAPLVERATTPAADDPQAVAPARWFAVIADPGAWSALLYMVLALPLGIAWFTWAVTGVSVTAGLLVLIVGIPVALLFLAVTRGIALTEGRIVEALLGERMPRRALREPRDASGLLARVRYWLADGRTWSSLAYLVLMLPLGIAYFTIAVVLGATSVALVLAPAALAVNDVQDAIDVSGWMVACTVALVPAGLLGVVGLLHVARGIGAVHGRLAKALLVGGGGRSNRRDAVSVPGSFGHGAVLLLCALAITGTCALAGAVVGDVPSREVTRQASASGVRVLEIDGSSVDVEVRSDSSLRSGEVRAVVRARVLDTASEAELDRLVRLDATGDVARLRSGRSCTVIVVLASVGCRSRLSVAIPDDGSVALRGGTGSGDVELRDLRAGSVDLEVRSGDLEGSVEAADSLDVEASSGDIDLRLGADVRSPDVRASSGDVSLRVPADWRVEASASSGDVDVPAAMRGRSSGGEVLRVSTSSGDIEVEAVR